MNRLSLILALFFFSCTSNEKLATGTYKSDPPSRFSRPFLFLRGARGYACGPYIKLRADSTYERCFCVSLEKGIYKVRNDSIFFFTKSHIITPGKDSLAKVKGFIPKVTDTPVAYKISNKGFYQFRRGRKGVVNYREFKLKTTSTDSLDK